MLKFRKYTDGEERAKITIELPLTRELIARLALYSYLDSREKDFPTGKNAIVKAVQDACYTIINLGIEGTDERNVDMIKEDIYGSEDFYFEGKYKELFDTIKIPDTEEIHSKTDMYYGFKDVLYDYIKAEYIKRFLK